MEVARSYSECERPFCVIVLRHIQADDTELLITLSVASDAQM